MAVVVDHTVVMLAQTAEKVVAAPASSQGVVVAIARQAVGGPAAAEVIAASIAADPVAPVSSSDDVAAREPDDDVGVLGASNPVVACGSDDGGDPPTAPLAAGGMSRDGRKEAEGECADDYRFSHHSHCGALDTSS